MKFSVITKFNKLCQALYFSPPQTCTFKMFPHLSLKIEQCSALFSVWQSWSMLNLFFLMFFRWSLYKDFVNYACTTDVFLAEFLTLVEYKLKGKKQSQSRYTFTHTHTHTHTHITLWHGCSLVSLLHVFRTAF